MLPLTPDAETRPAIETGFAPMLADGSPRYVVTMRDGAVFVLVAMVVNVAATLGAIGAGLAIGMSSPMTAEPPEETLALINMAHAVLLLVAGAAGVIGWWWLTARDPQETSFANTSRSRPVLRFTVVAQAALMLLLAAGPIVFGATLSDASPDAILAGAAGVMMLSVLAVAATMGVKFFATMCYLRWLAGRIPDETLDESAARFMWLGPMLVIGMPVAGALLGFFIPLVAVVCVLICPLAAVIMYWNLIFKTWKNLSEIAFDQRDKAELAAAARHNMAA